MQARRVDRSKHTATSRTCRPATGPIDYFKWDPDSGDNALKHPKIKLTVKDTKYHKYQWIMRFRQTIGSGTWDWDSGWWSMKGVYPGGGAREIDLTDPNLTGHLDAKVHPWGTYTYDIVQIRGTPY